MLCPKFYIVTLEMSTLNYKKKRVRLDQNNLANFDHISQKKKRIKSIVFFFQTSEQKTPKLIRSNFIIFVDI